MVCVLRFQSRFRSGHRECPGTIRTAAGRCRRMRVGTDWTGLGLAGGIEIYNGTNIVAITRNVSSVIAAPSRQTRGTTWTSGSITRHGRFPWCWMGKPRLPGWHFCGGGGNDFAAMGDFSISPVPEPSSLALLASGLVGGLAAASPQDSINKFLLPDHSSSP